MSQPNEIQFPCAELPDEIDARRLLGIYEMRQEGLLMQRIKVHAGHIQPAQWRMLGEIAAEFTPDYPLHLTTRQDVELHGVRPADVSDVQRGIEKAGLTTVGACGDTLRNVTTCPGAGLCPGSHDVRGLADAIRAAGESLPWIREMPRKFKISISGCEQMCARPWINDLGLVANADGSFRAIGSGSLGARPGAGIELYDGLEREKLVPLLVASLRFFNKEGDRENRRRARWRHVRERLGEDEFRERLEERFSAELQESSWPVPEVPRVGDGKPESVHLNLPRGDMPAEDAVAVADAAEAADAALRLGFEHDLWIYSGSEVDLPADIADLADRASIVACPGSTWCQRGIGDSRAAEGEIRAADGELSGLRLGISGCPNNCAHAAVADIGLIGCIRTVAGVRTPCFRLYAGGDKGEGPRLGTRLHAAVPASEVADVVSSLASCYRRERESAQEGFADFAERNSARLGKLVSAHVREYEKSAGEAQA